MTSHRIGVNLRVSGNCDQGARKYMEDNHVIKFLKKDTDDYEFAYFGIFDGHGGPEASAFCRDNLLNEITKYDGFWTNDDEQVLSAIRKGFLDTHHAMWNVLDTWPKTVTGLPSTAGSTATIAIIKQGKLYTGHVGDSALVLGENDAYSGGQFPVQAICVTKEHKPDDPDERLRIEDAGGEVINKSGVPRVVWSRPKTNHKGPVRRSTQIDQIPFLAVARSLGDLWSYDYYTETYVVSPDPDVSVLKLDPSKHRCLILASDGLWNMLTPEESVHMVMDLENQFEEKIVNDPNVAVSFWSNPAERLVSRALNKWRSKALKADNTSCVVVLVDPLGPSKLTLLKRKRQELFSAGEMTSTQLNKLQKMSTEIDQRGKPRNKNANCSLSDSHIRVTDDSIIQPVSERERSTSPTHRRSFSNVSHSGPKSAAEDRYNESINDSVQYLPKPPIKWNLRHPVEDQRMEPMNVGSGRNAFHPTKRIPPHPNAHRHSTACLSPSESFHRKGETGDKGKLNNVGCGGKDSKKEKVGKKFSAELGSRGADSEQNLQNGEVDIESDDIENEDSDSDFETSIPEPPPSTPCSDVKELDRGGESDDENSLHSSANITDKAFSLASDESIGTPESSFGDNSHPPTPLSAPAKLSSTRARKGHMSKSAKRKLARSGKKLHHFSKPPTGIKAKPSSLFKSPAAVSKSSKVSKTAASSNSRVVTGKAEDRTVMNNSISTSRVSSSLTKGSTTSHLVSPPKRVSPPRRVLNTSKSMNDFGTPKNQKESLRSASCTGLTPDMSLLMSNKTRSTLNNTVGTCTVSDNVNNDITSQLFHSFMAADMADSRAAFTLRSCRETSMIVEDTDIPGVSSVTQTEPLKQLNKTGPIRKTGSKRWGNFLRASKQSIDHMFHLGNHRRSTAGGDTTKLATTSTGQLECRTTKVVSSRNTSLSTSKLADITSAHHHLPDITISHLADLTANASTLTAGDLTTLSALSAEDSMLSAADINAAHHSMLEAGLQGKVTKHRKGFLQKTKGTLRRARKAAKKAFFPENHRLFNHKSSGTKRKSDEFLTTPEMKRQRQVEMDK